jgi:tetratricopeptide (TPR) repeat protein
MRGERLLELLSDGIGGLCFLVGESGAGKTSLMSELATQARQRNMRTVMCECQDVGVGGATRVAAPALHPFRPLLRAIANDCRNDDLLRARVLGEREETLRQYEPSLRGYPGQAPARDGAVRDATGERVLRDLTLTLAAYAAEQPLLLCLDDLQWADALTIRFLTASHADFYTQRGILVVGSVRSTDIPPDLERVMSADEVTRIDVGALDRTSVEAMVQDMLALSSPLPHLVEFLHQHAGGNPLFIAEYLHAAVAEGLVVRDKGAWVLKAAGRERFRQLSTPESVCELVLRRFGLLNAEERAFAEAAAVLGRRCTPAQLSFTAEMNPPGASATLEALARSHILQVAADDSVYFTHDRVRESIYFNLSESSRRALHRRAALALEHSLTDSESDRLTYPQLAHHLRESEQLASASRYFELAGLSALYGAATRDAREHLEQALLLDATESPVRAARLHRAVAEACLGLGDLAKMTTHLELALVHVGVRLPNDVEARTRFILAATWQQLRRRLLPGAPLVADGRDRELAREACLALQLLSIRYIFEDDAPNVVTTALAAVNFGEAAGGQLRMASPYSSLGYVARLARLRPVADHYFRMATESAKRANDLDDHAEARSNEAAAALGAADWKAAQPAVDDALSLSKLARNPQQEEVALTVRFYIDYFRGRYAEALASLPPLLESATARGNTQHMGWALVMRATVAQEQGDLESAERDLDEARIQLLSVRDRVTETLCIGILAGIKARRGCFDEALALSREAAERIADKFPVVFSVAKGLEGAALAPLLAWQEAVERGVSPGTLPAQASKACQQYLSYGRIFPVGAPGSHLMMAFARRLGGEGLRARWHGYRALLLGTRLDMPYAAACAHAELASRGPQRDFHTKRAVAGFTRLGLSADETQLRSSSARIARSSRSGSELWAKSGKRDAH